MLSGSPLAAKVIGGVLNSNLDERHWITVLKIWNCEIGLSHKFPSNPLKSCFLYKVVSHFAAFFAHDHDCPALSTSIIGAMAEWFVGPIMDKIINACSDYLEEQVGWQTGMKKELERLRENHLKIQAVVFAANQAQISDQSPDLNQWVWQLRDAIDEADDVVDEFEYMKHKEQLTKNTEETKKTTKFMSFLFESPRKILKIGERVLKRDPNLKRLEEAVQKLDKVSADVTTFLHLLDSAKQEQKEEEVDFYKTRETGSLPKNDLIGRRKEKELECGKLIDDEESSDKNFETIRHLSVQTTNSDIIKKIGQFKYLHSLFLFYKTSNKDLCSALIKIFKASRCLRLLYIRTDELAMIPEEIKYLKHLRYLKIEIADVTRLPRSLSNLYHLQYIIYDRWVLRRPEVDDFLPSDINDLSNLRYMELPMNCISSISGIGKLKSLQELNMFDLRDVSGYRIGELENMNDLRKLGINCLENVKDAEEACGAKLYEKRRLTDLTLCWSNTGWWNIDLNENVLDNLQPPKCLRNLSIKRYMGARSSIWMNNVNPIFNLEKIELDNCLEWEILPPFGQLPFLKSLVLRNMPKVKWLESKFNGNDEYRAFPLLEVLSIYRLKALEDWFEAGVAAEDGCLFPCLIELVLQNCPKLKELPSLPPKLMILKIKNTGWKTLNCCSISNSTPLATLEVSDCPNIISLLLADEIAIIAALRNLTIKKCPNLISLGRYRKVETTNNCHLILNSLNISDPSVLLMEPLRSIASLKKLSFEDNEELVSFPIKAEQWFLKVRSSLCELEFRCLKSLESLPSSLESLSSLQKLYIGHGVPMLRELPYLPPSLEYLYIWGCQPELFERYREDGGSDRHKIAHIPHIHISTKY
ncbi:hypothetical protein IEQ34_007746 [Dendrobium chrysotoxum]|uniref:Rx N-terminal domain-containing protein n=1 Tax=Dendrobium chrysotoxum TaxID=161865 RepID=A0AAV7H508_DENCH|nr:hypothetical protein IEQ34_007746 [Dendrobium chrysotoxum]